jgi:hypothetical protein
MTTGSAGRTTTPSTARRPTGLAAYPGLRRGVRAQRAFLANAVGYLAGTAGIGQFLDIGTGIPTASNTHEVAHAADPDARIVYVDNDPMVLTHARALPTGSRPGTTSYLDADLRDTGKILAETAALLDFRRPVGVLLIGILQLIPEQQRHADGGNHRERELADRCAGRGDVDQLVCGHGAQRQGHDQIGHAEGVEPQGGAAARALREPARDQRRGDTGGDVAQARGQGKQRGQMTEGHDQQESHPVHRPERVRQLQAARHARRGQGAGHHRYPAQRQQQAQEADHSDRHPWHSVAEPRVVPAVIRDHRTGGEPAAEHDGRAPGQQPRTLPSSPARIAPPYSTTQVAARMAMMPAMAITHR